MTDYHSCRFAGLIGITALSIAFSSPFSQVNRLESPAFPAQVLLHDSLREEKVLSLSHSPLVPDTTHTFAVRFGRTLTLLRSELGLAYENRNIHSQAAFGSFFNTLGLHSRHLSASVAINLYSTDVMETGRINEIEYERSLSGMDHFSGNRNFDFHLVHAFFSLHFPRLRVDIGNKKLRWGPGYKGSLSLSGTTFAPFYFYHLQFQLGTLFYFSNFLAGFDDEARYNEEVQSVDTYIAADNQKSLSSLPARYQAGQRLDIRLGTFLQVGLYEMVNFFGNNELNRYLNPLQIYYLGNIESGTNNANLLGGIDFNLLFSQSRVYGDLLNDDVTIFENIGNPNKYAFQVGWAWYAAHRTVSEIGIEYTHVAPYVYSHSRVLNRHEYRNNCLGWPWGNDQDVLNLHTRMHLSEKITSFTELGYWIKGKRELRDDWFSDGQPDMDHAPYWPQNASRCISALVSITYTPVLQVRSTTFFRAFWEEGRPDHSFHTFLQCTIPSLWTHTTQK